MSTKQASPLVGVIILIGFVVIGMAMLFTVRDKLQTKELHAEHSSWANIHAAPQAATELAQPRTVLASYEPNPRPGAKVRTLREFYDRRGFAGGPPIIPHDVEVDGVMNDDCLSCHEDGGFVPEHNAYTPITPHPEMDNCRQCHVPQIAEGEFAQTTWTQPDLPKRGRQAIPGGPLLMPHGLQMRENCLACHAGPHAVVEIKTSHPERENCMQCHVLDQDFPPFKSVLNPHTELANAEK